jgi:YHS domain-containing protein
MRLLILIALVYFGYRAVKSWMLQGSPGPRPAAGSGPDTVEDLMVKDPYCQVYFPKREAVHARIGGEDVYFCSSDCRDKFLNK